MKLNRQWNCVIWVAGLILLIIVGSYIRRSNKPSEVQWVEKKSVIQIKPAETTALASSETKSAVMRKQCYRFAENSSDLTDTIKIKLDKQARYLLDHSSARISLIGYLDARESYYSHPKLGKRRVENMRSYLKTKSVTLEQVALQKPKKGAFSIENCHVELVYYPQK